MLLSPCTYSKIKQPHNSSFTIILSLSAKKPTIIETIRLNRLCWFKHVQSMDENRIPKMNMNFRTKRLRGREEIYGKMR